MGTAKPDAEEIRAVFLTNFTLTEFNTIPGNKMGQYSVGDAIKLLMEKSGWKPKAQELRLRDEWETIVGKTIAKYTRTLYLSGETLTIYTDVAALKQELMMGKEQLIKNINDYFGEKVVTNIMIK